jgi:hypothetical protein
MFCDYYDNVVHTNDDGQEYDDTYHCEEEMTSVIFAIGSDTEGLGIGTDHRFEGTIAVFTCSGHHDQMLAEIKQVADAVWVMGPNAWVRQVV